MDQCHTYLQRYGRIFFHINLCSQYCTLSTEPSLFVLCNNISFNFFAAMGCPAPELPKRVGVSCTPSLSSPVSAGTLYPLDIVCTFSCDEGHQLQGELSMECTRSGQWTATPPTCIGIYVNTNYLNYLK